MTKQEKLELMKAYEEVFDGLDDVRLCCREACARLIRIMKKYTNVDVGDESSGVLKTDEMRDEYYELIKS